MRIPTCRSIAAVWLSVVLALAETRKVRQVARGVFHSQLVAEGDVESSTKPVKGLTMFLFAFNPTASFRSFTHVTNSPVHTLAWHATPRTLLPAERMPLIHRMLSQPQLKATESVRLPADKVRALLPIRLAVFVQMLGVGVNLCTLPLFLLSLGCSPNQLGMTISCFSAAQMIGAPFLVSLSNRPGISKLTVLRVCLTGNAVASMLTACAGGWHGITCARMLAGFSAASVPVAQVAVADAMPPGPITSKALTLVSSASSLGIVMGPLFGSLVAEVAERFFNIPIHLQPRAVFAASGIFAVMVLLLTSGVRLTTPSATPESLQSQEGGVDSSNTTKDSGSGNQMGDSIVSPPSFLQPLLRWTTLVCSMSVTTGVAVYALFGQQFLGYGQHEISASQSCAALAALACQLVVLPRLLARLGEGLSCACGLLVLGIAFMGFSLVRLQPLHFIMFIASRAGYSIAETANVALTALSSTPEKRGRNLALLTSTQSGSRLFSPLLASYLYTLSNKEGANFGPGGALPFIFVGSLALLTSPVPLLVAGSIRRLRSVDQKAE